MRTDSTAQYDPPHTEKKRGEGFHQSLINQYEDEKERHGTQGTINPFTQSQLFKVLLSSEHSFDLIETLTNQYANWILGLG